MTYAIQTGLKNSSFSSSISRAPVLPRHTAIFNSPTRLPVNPLGDIRQQRLSGSGVQIVPPNPINPFANPSGAIPQFDPKGGASPFGSMLRYVPGKGLTFLDAEQEEDLRGNPIEMLEKAINENKVDIAIGAIGIVMVIAAVVQIAKPI